MANDLLEWDLRRHEALKTWLSSQTVSVLAGLLMECAGNDDAVRVVLRCLADRETTGQVNPHSLSEAVRFLTADPDSKAHSGLHYDQFEHRLNWLLVLLDATLNQRNAVGVVEATELALERSEILVMADLDSEYWADSVHRDLRRLHRLACERTRPDPIALAERWARMRKLSKLGWHDDFAEAYADVLGPEGLSAHERAMRGPTSGDSR